MNTVKEWKKNFNWYFIIIKEEEKQSNNTCWICKKFIEKDNENVRDHCHITKNFRSGAHWSCNINLQLTEKFPVIFHN